ncbi:MAG TPA: histidinol-phosphate transaminase [Vicinamibacteria bacterium]|nr:histidinol-phosphate transaminase [Vicinamibacteria bacterium]
MSARPAPVWFEFPAHLQGLDRFEAGKPIAEVRRELGLSDVIKLASNENPLGPSPRALEAAHAALADAHRYPDPQATELRAALAAHLGVPASHLLVGNGSVEIVDLVVRALLGPGDNAVISEHAFVRFRQIVSAHNHGARLVPMREWTHDLPAMTRAVDERTRLVFVANPNNPTGTWNVRAEVEALVEGLPPRCLLVLDQAYFEFADHPDYPDGVELVRRGAPVVVTRTFSKAYGLGGLRAGYAVALPEVLDALFTIREAFGTNSVSQAAAAAALSDQEHVRRTVALNRVEKARLSAALRQRGFAVLPSLGNFLTFDTRADGREVFRRLLVRGVIVRPLDPYQMKSWLRVSIGTEPENAAFLAALDAATGGTEP